MQDIASRLFHTSKCNYVLVQIPFSIVHVKTRKRKDISDIFRALLGGEMYPLLVLDLYELSETIESINQKRR